MYESGLGQMRIESGSENLREFYAQCGRSQIALVVQCALERQCGHALKWNNLDTEDCSFVVHV